VDEFGAYLDLAAQADRLLAKARAEARTDQFAAVRKAGEAQTRAILAVAAAVAALVQARADAGPTLDALREHYARQLEAAEQAVERHTRAALRDALTGWTVAGDRDPINRHLYAVAEHRCGFGGRTQVDEPTILDLIDTVVMPHNEAGCGDRDV